MTDLLTLVVGLPVSGWPAALAYRLYRGHTETTAVSRRVAAVVAVRPQALPRADGRTAVLQCFQSRREPDFARRRAAAGLLPCH